MALTGVLAIGMIPVAGFAAGGASGNASREEAAQGDSLPELRDGQSSDSNMITIDAAIAGVEGVDAAENGAADDEASDEGAAGIGKGSEAGASGSDGSDGASGSDASVTLLSVQSSGAASNAGNAANAGNAGNSINAANDGSANDAGSDDETSGDPAPAKQSPNPFKAGVDAQPIANLENYYGNKHAENFKDKAWKTSVGCTGKKRWTGTVRNDDGFFAPGVEETWDGSAPSISEYDAEVYAYIEENYQNTVDGTPRDVIFVFGDCGLSSVDFHQLFDGTYDVYMNIASFNDTDIKDLVLPSFVKELKERSFYVYLSEGLSSVTFETDAQGNGIERIEGGAFTNNKNLSKQDLIVIPHSCKYLEGYAFGTYDGSVNVRIDNPDVRFGDEYTDADKVENPFAGGGTVIAYRYKSDGIRESDPWLLAHQQNAPDNITWYWLDDGQSRLSLSGSLALPAGMDAGNVSVTLTQGSATIPLTLDENNAFSYDQLLVSTDVELTVAVSGYYEKSLLRLAADMTSNWDVGVIDVTALTPIPVQRAYPVTVRFDTGRTDAQGNPVYASISDWNSLSFRLFNGETELTAGAVAEDGTFTGDYAMQRGMAVLSDALANTEGVPENLKLEVSRGAAGYSPAEASYNADAGGFTVTLARWGNVRVTTTCTAAADDLFSGQARVMVFAGTDDSARKVADGYTTPTGLEEDSSGNVGGKESWQFTTDQLEAGTYTVVAFKTDDVKASASRLRAARDLGFNLAETTVDVKDGEQTDVTLDVPTFSVADVLASMGVKSVSVRSGKNPVVAGCETILSIDYEMTSAQAATLILGGIEGSADGNVSDLSITVGDETARWSSANGNTTIELPADQAKGTVYVAFKPGKEQAYSLPVSMHVKNSTVSVGNAAFVALGMGIAVDSGYVSQEYNTATVYAAPGSTVRLKVGDTPVGKAAVTNNLGRASIAFDLPESVASGLLYDDSVKIEATATKDGNAYESYAYATYRPATKLWSFKVTNEGVTQELIKDGNRTNNFLTVHHQLARQNCAYWTFDFTVKNAGNAINAGDTLMMYVTLESGSTVPVALTKAGTTSDDVTNPDANTYTRFVGEYVDEAYLSLLERYDSFTIFIWNFIADEDLFIPKSYSFNAFDLSCVIDVNSEDYQKRMAERAKQQVRDRYAIFEEVFPGSAAVDESVTEICTKTLEMLGDLEEAINQGVEEGLYSEDEARASLEEIEALKPDFTDPTKTFLEPNEDTWVANIDNDTFTGRLAELVEWSKSIDLSIDDAYETEEEKQAVHKYFDGIKNAVENGNTTTSLTNRELRKAAQKVADTFEVANPNNFDSPAAWLDQNLKDGVDGMKISSGTAASGEPDQSLEQGRFAGDAFLKTNGDNPPSGYTCVVTENPPAKYAGSEPKKTSYTVNLKEVTDYRDNWKEDTAWTVGLNAAGYLVDWLGNLKNKPVEAATTLRNAVASTPTLPPPATAPGTVGRKVSLAKVGPVNLSKTAQTVAESQKELAKAAEQTASAAKNSKSWWSALPVVGTGLQAVGLQRTIDSWYGTSDKLGVLEAEIEGIYNWILYYKQKNPCDSDCQRCLQALYAERDAAEKYRDWLMAEDSQNYVESQYGWLMLNAGAAASLLSMEGAPTASDIIGKCSLATDLGGIALHRYTAVKLDELLNKYNQATAYRESVCKNTAKEREKDKESTEDGKGAAGKGKYNVRASLILDPSGTVYEALESNPVEGATATVWTRGGFLGLQEQQWDAAAYEQKNPQTTGADGAFAWDTPTGEYQVRVSKDGYKDSASEWLNVLPIQTGVKVKLESTKAPQVASAWATPEYVELTFDQYMKVNDKLDVSLSGPEVDRIEWVDPQESSEADGYGTLSRTLRIYPKEPLAESTQVDVTVNGAQNYVGTNLTDNQYKLTVAKRPAQLVANFENSVVLQTGAQEATQITAYVRYADGAPVPGQRVVARLASGSIASFADGVFVTDPDGSVWMEGVTDAEGKVNFALSGALPGMTKLELSASGTTLTKELAVRVTSDAAQPVRPVATIDGHEFGATSPKVNSVTVKKGSQLSLSCTTEGATIYYTTDNTCPCKPENQRYEYTGPITVTENTLFRITAYKEGMPFDEYSERLNLAVTVEGSDEPLPPVDPDNPGGDNPNGSNSNGSQGNNLGGGGKGNGAGVSKLQTLATTGDSMQSVVVLLVVAAAIACVVCVSAVAIRRRGAARRRR